VEIYEGCPASEKSFKRIERDLDLLLNSNVRTQKTKEKALIKMMPIE